MTRTRSDTRQRAIDAAPWAAITLLAASMTVGFAATGHPITALVCALLAILAAVGLAHDIADWWDHRHQ